MTEQELDTQQTIHSENKEASIQLEATWLEHLADEFNKPYMAELKAFLTKEKAQKKVIYPAGKNIFAALNTTPFDQVKVVILGQDPYHGPNQAHGLCFSVMPGTPLPPSLMNMYKELQKDLDISNFHTGYLLPWAQQGILLLNNVLTVEQGKAASHQGRGWEEFTDKVIETLNDHHEGLIFLLWGSHAQRKCANIDTNKHHILKTTHPSPLSAHRGFMGCGHFSKTNELLQTLGKEPINWQL